VSVLVIVNTADSIIITYHRYKYSLPSVAWFIPQSGDYYLFPPPEISGGQGSERVNVVWL